MMKYLLEYIKDERAEGSIEKIIMITATISVALFVGWWIWEKVKNRTNQSKCTNSDNPWCVE